MGGCGAQATPSQAAGAGIAGIPGAGSAAAMPRTSESGGAARAASRAAESGLREPETTTTSDHLNHPASCVRAHSREERPSSLESAARIRTEPSLSPSPPSSSLFTMSGFNLNMLPNQSLQRPRPTAATAAYQQPHHQLGAAAAAAAPGNEWSALAAGGGQQRQYPPGNTPSTNNLLNNVRMSPNSDPILLPTTSEGPHPSRPLRSSRPTRRSAPFAYRPPFFWRYLVAPTPTPYRPPPTLAPPLPPAPADLRPTTAATAASGSHSSLHV